MTKIRGAFVALLGLGLCVGAWAMASATDCRAEGPTPNGRPMNVEMCASKAASSDDGRALCIVKCWTVGGAAVEPTVEVTLTMVSPENGLLEQASTTRRLSECAQPILCTISNCSGVQRQATVTLLSATPEFSIEVR